MNRSWRDWGLSDWNEALLDHHFAIEDIDAPVRRLDITWSSLADVTGDASAEPDEVRGTFLGALRDALHTRDCSLLVAAKRGIEENEWTTDTERTPPFFVHLMVTCYAAGDFEGELLQMGEFRQRLGELTAGSSTQSMERLPGLWEDLAAWLDERNEYRPLELPDPEHETLIGYSKRLAFPSRRDHQTILSVLDDEGLLGADLPLLATIRAMDEATPRFSENFVREWVRGKSDRESAVWGAIRDLASRDPLARGRRSEQSRWKILAEPDEDGRLLPFVVGKGPYESDGLETVRFDGPPGFEFALRSTEDRPNEDPFDTAFLAVVRGATDTPPVTGVRSASEQGILLFEYVPEHGFWEFSRRKPSASEVRALIRDDRVDSFETAVRPVFPDVWHEPSAYDGWVLVRGMHGADFAAVDFAESVLEDAQALQNTVTVPRIHLAGGIRLSSGSFLLTPSSLPEIRVAADAVLARNDDGHVELVEETANCWRFPATAFAEYSDAVEFELEARSGAARVTRTIRLVPGAGSPKPRWVEESKYRCEGATTPATDVLPPDRPAYSSSGEPASLSPCPQLEPSGSFSAHADEAVSIVAGLCARKTGLRPQELFDVFEEVLGIDDPRLLWDVIRGWEESTALLRVSSKKWRDIRFLAVPAHAVLYAAGEESHLALAGAVTPVTRELFFDVATSHGAHRRYRQGTSSMIPVPPTVFAEDMVTCERIAAELGAPVVPLESLEGLLPTPSDPDGEPPLNFEVYGDWDWTRRRIDTSPKPNVFDGVRLTLHRRADAPDYWVVWHDGEVAWWSRSRTWSLIRAYREVGHLPFQREGAVIRRTGFGLHLPIGVGRFLALTANRVPGPRTDSEGAYDYAMPSEEAAHTVLDAVDFGSTAKPNIRLPDSVRRSSLGSSESEVELREGEFYWCRSRRQKCKLVELNDDFGDGWCRCWFPGADSVVAVPADELVSLQNMASARLDELRWVAASAKVLDTLEREPLVAPLSAKLLPLPHQIRALERALSRRRVRWLLADEVGLGKTIEAGLILRELKFRGRVKRILIVTPTGLVNQWVSELKTHFDEDFRAVSPAHFGALRSFVGVGHDANLWAFHDQVIVPMDSVKPSDGRRDWDDERTRDYNRERFEHLVAAGWDLVIVDEAHRLAGSSSSVARYRLGKGLAETVPYVLMLSATPHRGKTDAFRRLLGLVAPDEFQTDDDVARAKVKKYVIRTEKRRAIDADGDPLFKPRDTELHEVRWDSARSEQEALYRAVTEYVRDSYNKAIRSRNYAMGFLMILMQRLVTSSTAAIRTALERRRAALESEPGQVKLFEEDVGDDWTELDGQEQMEDLLRRRLKGMKDERDEVELLISAARRCEARAPDAKAEQLVELIRQLAREENEPGLKVLIFTEFVATQDMLAQFLGQRGFDVVCLNGSLGLQDRVDVQEEFRTSAQVMVSTDAGGEGLNLQFCHVVVNYDLPWNPMKLEQRIGRVDRIGQTETVRAINFVIRDTVEARVREVLEEKLERIMREFGVDKLSDVLDSSEVGADFEKLYAEAVSTPEEAEERVEKFAETVREQARAAREGSKIIETDATDLRPDKAKKLENHQLSYWTRQAVLSFVRCHGGEVSDGSSDGLAVRWPDGSEDDAVVFDNRASGQLLGVDDPKVKRVLTNLPPVVPGQPIPVTRVTDVSNVMSGVWSLWKVETTRPVRRTRCIPLFVRSDGQVSKAAAKVVWERLVSGEGFSLLNESLVGREAELAYRKSKATVRGAIEEESAELLEELGEILAADRKRLEQRTQANSGAGTSAWSAAMLDARREAELRKHVHDFIPPDASLLLLLRVEGESTGT